MANAKLGRVERSSVYRRYCTAYEIIVLPESVLVPPSCIAVGRAFLSTLAPTARPSPQRSQPTPLGASLWSPCQCPFQSGLDPLRFEKDLKHGWLVRASLTH